MLTKQGNTQIYNSPFGSYVVEQHRGALKGLSVACPSRRPRSQIT